MKYINKKDLIDNAWYRGEHRIAIFALWDVKKKLFWYIREKFGDLIEDCACHPEDDDGYALFHPQEFICMN
jgi:hypothetical protein